MRIVGQDPASQCPYECGLKSEEPETDLEQLFDLGNDALVEREQDQVILGFDQGVVVRHDDLLATDDGGDRGAFRQRHIADAPAHHLGGLEVAVDDDFQHLGGATATLGGSLVMLATPSLRPLGLVTLCANVGSHLVVQLLKRSIARRRPALAVDWLRALTVAPDAWSFPSGPAAAATAVAVPFALNGHPAAPILLGLAVLVGMSRVYLRVHFPTDVVAGYVIGTAGAITAWLATP